MDLFQRRDIGFTAYWCLAQALRCLPVTFRLRHSLSAARLAARLWLLLAPAERRQMARNLALTVNGHYARADLPRLIFSHYETHAWNFVINDLLPRLSPAQIRSFSELRGLEHLEAARGAGRGAVLLSAHYGAHAYTILAVLLAYGCPVTAVLGQELRPAGDASRYYRRLIDPVRASPRAALPVLTVGGVSPRALAAPLLRNEALLMLGDMHLLPEQAAREQHALPVPFLAGTAAVRTGPLRLPKLLGAPVLPTFSLRRGARVVVEIEEPLELRPGKTRDDFVADLRAYLERLERRIRAAPDQWGHMRHENIPFWIHVEPRLAEQVTGRDRSAPPARVVPMRAEHVDDVVRVHLDSFSGFFLTFLGPRFLKLLYSEILRTPDHVAFVAHEDAGRLTGFVVGVTNQADLYRRLARRRWFAFAGASLRAVVRRPAIIPRLFGALRYPAKSEAAAAQALLMSIAVGPETHGRGVGRSLAIHFLLAMQQKDVARVSLTTDRDGNDRANRFYQRLGFQIARTYAGPGARWMNEYVIDLSTWSPPDGRRD